MHTQRLKLAGSSSAKRPPPQAGATDLSPAKLPTREQHDGVIEEYIKSLSIRKREKALISQEMFDDIWDVLHHPSNARIRSPQFRFWVRKMFKLSSSVSRSSSSDDDADVISAVTHEGRPVAVKEQIYDILSYYHTLAGHGGRDKTMAEVKENYSWVPKELVARFVKICPTCIFKKTGVATRLPTPGSFTGKVSLPQPHETRSSPFDEHDTDTLNSSYSQAISLTSSEEGWLVNSTLAPTRPALAYPAHTLNSLMESRILPVPVLSPVLRSPPLGSPNLSADPRKWLADLTMQPGPNYVGTSHKFPPLALRRIGTENDAQPIRGPSTRITLPPLMKALSEGMADPNVSRPAFNVPSNLGIPRRVSNGTILEADVDMANLVGGSFYPAENHPDVDYSNIDPALLGEALPVVGAYDNYAHQSKPETRLTSLFPPFAQSVILPVDFDCRVPTMQRSISEDSVSSVASSVKSTASQNRAPSLATRRHVSNVSAKTSSGFQQSSSYDAQDWESTYCLDDV